jgi:hypothetical protein
MPLESGTGSFDNMPLGLLCGFIAEPTNRQGDRKLFASISLLKIRLFLKIGSKIFTFCIWQSSKHLAMPGIIALNRKKAWFSDAVLTIQV